MRDSEPTVFVIDDDEAMCESLQWLLQAEGLAVETYSSAEAFLNAFRIERAGCIVLDVRMQGMSGLDLQARLAADGASLPVIVITGHGNVPMAVRAVKAGALEFLEKPVNDQVLLRHIRLAIDTDRQRRSQRNQLTQIRQRFATLTPREREVLDLVVEGRASKQIATTLSITEKTVEAHRKHIMRKMVAQSTVALVRMVLLLRDQAQNP
jgi:FixJ family two-component response regulator